MSLKIAVYNEAELAMIQEAMKYAVTWWAHVVAITGTERDIEVLEKYKALAYKLALEKRRRG